MQDSQQRPAARKATDQAADRAYMDRLLAAMSPVNQEHARHYLEAREANGLKLGSLKNITVALSRLDHGLAGEPLPEVQPDQLRSIVAHYSRNFSPTSVNSWCGVVKAWLTHIRGGTLPRPFALALARKRAQAMRDIQEVTEEERDALLRAAAAHEDPLLRAKHTWIVWGLWDTSFRDAEFRSLRPEWVEPDPRSDGNCLRLIEGGPDLKTGVRRIYTVDCAGALAMLLPLLPAGAAYLLPGRQAGHYTSRHYVRNILRDLCKKAGIRHLHPHLFRHTRATRAARAGWIEAKLCAFFGWAPGSRMPSTYVHLALSDLADRVRQDANLDPLAALIREDPQKALTRAIADAVSATLRQMGQHPPPSLNLVHGAARFDPWIPS